ncbi:hypothetical protein AGMMS50256_35400 [Betaproteobacteria bacterium]|nr:hypothetical protein AGMMS50256_35400 [Betaproteobacteria bacterium]
MNLVRGLSISAGCALLLCACATPITTPPLLRALTCKNLPAGDEQFRAIQQALVDRGYDPGPLDGQTGPKTREALRQFQIDKSLRITGTADAATREALGFCEEHAPAPAPASATHPPTISPQVQEAQRLLTERGYAPGAVDGLMGNKTREALRRFQGDNGLPVSGRVDEPTLGALRAAAKPEQESALAIEQPPEIVPPAETEPPIASQPATLPASPASPAPTPESTEDFALPPPASPMPTLPVASQPATLPASPASPTSTPESTEDFALPPPASSMPTPPVAPAPPPGNTNGSAQPPA